MVVCDDNITVAYFLKGCVQGYGNYEKLTPSIDPRKLFDDVADNRKLPYSFTTDVAIEECNDVLEEETYQTDINSIDNIHFLPIEKTRGHVRSRYLERNHEPNFNHSLDRESLLTRLSMLSLVSMPNIFVDKVTNCFIL